MVNLKTNYIIKHKIKKKFNLLKIFLKKFNI